MVLPVMFESENPDQQMGAFTKYMSDFQNEFTEQSFNNPTDYLVAMAPPPRTEHSTEVLLPRRAG